MCDEQSGYESYSLADLVVAERTPSHWSRARLGDVAVKVTAGGTPSRDVPEYWADGNDGIPWVTIADLTRSAVVESTQSTLTEEGVQAARLSLVPSGSLLYSIYATLGKVGVTRIPVTTNQAILGLELSDAVDSRFVKYWLRNFEPALGFLSSSNTQANLSGEKVRKLPLPLPPVPEQSKIADFLDHETARIDALIAKQEQLIELLQEKRDALTLHYVTKGLRGEAALKSVEREWIRTMPTHWELVRIRHVAKLESGHTPSRQHPEYWENCYIPWVTLSDVGALRSGREMYVRDTQEKVSDLGIANSAARVLPAGTVVLSRTASVGFSAILASPMATTQDFANWVCGGRVVPEYLYLVLQAMKPEYRRLMMGSTHQTIYMPDIADLRMPLPPMAEQREVVDVVIAQRRQIDSTQDQARELVRLLQERRSALISEAVSGQIDVRAWG